MKNQLEKDVNTFPELIKEVETYAGTCPDSASVAILHSMIAEMYNNYYMQNRWNVNQRTELAGYVPMISGNGPPICSEKRSNRN